MHAKKNAVSIVLAGGLVTASTVVSLSANANQELEYTKEAIGQHMGPRNIIKEDNIEINDNEVSNEVLPEVDIEDSNGFDILVDEVTEVEEKVENAKYQVPNFQDLKNFANYDQYIEFASNLYFVDFNEAKAVVAEKFPTFNSSENSELKRMIDLKEKGIINGDINVMGIFITIKNYAINQYDLDKQTPIISDKTPEQREQDLIDVARYIYGIEDTNLLNCIIAIHRTETGHGTENLTIQKNNLGGNLSPAKGDPDTAVINTYKTNEIGAESMIRNFLIIYDKCLYNEECNVLDSIPVFMSKVYCTHTLKEWALLVTELLKTDNIDEAVQGYIHNSSKTY